jgi:hypothetical protein
VITARPQHGQAAFAVDHEGVEGVAVARDLARGQVDEGVRALGDGGQIGGVEDGAAMEAQSRMSGEVPEVLQRAVGQVVEARDLVAARDQPLGQVRADEAGDPGDGDSQRTSCGNPALAKERDYSCTIGPSSRRRPP